MCPVGVTIHDVAARAGVSIKSVSRVMNHEPNVREELRARVVEAMEALDYIPNAGARRMASTRSFLIGLFFHTHLHSYITGIQLGAARRCIAKDYLLAVEPIEQNDDHYREMIERTVRRAHLDGVIVVPPISNDLAAVELLERLEVPFVRVSPTAEPERTSRVYVDDRHGAYEAARHIISLGHREIAFIGGPPMYGVSRLRRQGFLEAMTEAGLAVPEAWVTAGEFTFASGQERGRELLTTGPRPTAIVAANDAMAAGVLAAANRLGVVVPRDLSVIGFDDAPIASTVTPTLSTVRQPLEQIGLAAVDILFEMRAQKSTGVFQRLLNIEVIARESTAALDVSQA